MSFDPVVQDRTWFAHGAPFTDRRHPDPWPLVAQHTQVDAFVLDRSRVVATNAFRRLQNKTQVFVTSTGDHFRTRLTHTLEVAHTARQICTALQLNEDLAEVTALAHDLGHPPFGHAGERVLNEFAIEHDLPGFEHNFQSLRVVEFLEHPYPPFRGLNLTRAVRDSLAGHSTPFDQPALSEAVNDHESEQRPRQLCLEGQVVNLADQIAYLVHDLEDAWLMGLVKAVPVWPPLASWSDILPNSWRADVDTNVRVRRPVCEAWRDQLIADCVATTRQRLEQLPGPARSAIGVQKLDRPLVAFSPAMAEAVNMWREFNLQRIYRHPTVTRREARCTLMLRHLAQGYFASPELLPPRFRGRIDDQGKAQVVIDYVAGMTDRFAEQQFEAL